MKIGLDLRFLGENLYSRFVIELLQNLLFIDNENEYNLYLKSEIPLEKSNVKKFIVNINEGSLKEQTTFLKILKNDDSHIMVFFNENKPIFYKKDYVILINSLKDIYYQDFDNSLEKNKYLFLIKNSIKNAKKIICLDENTSDELVERMNLNEAKINILTPFFPRIKEFKEENEIKIDVKNLNNIKNDYLIYPGGAGIQKNLDRLVDVINRLNKENKKIDLVIFGDMIARDVQLRNLILQNNLQSQFHFLGNLSQKEKKYFYEQSLGVIFPSLYESFPFSLNEAVYLNIPILSSNYKNIKNIFGESIKYFSPISTSDTKNEILNFIEKRENYEYKEILAKYSALKSAKEFLEIIKSYY